MNSTPNRVWNSVKQVKSVLIIISWVCVRHIFLRMSTTLITDFQLKTKSTDTWTFTVPNSFTGWNTATTRGKGDGDADHPHRPHPCSAFSLNWSE